MKLVIQRVSSSSVMVDGKIVGSINRGLNVLIGVEPSDGEAQVLKAISKLLKLRVFPDSQGLMNLSLEDIQGQLLLISQFTLLADMRKGTRPGFSQAAAPKHAEMIYNRFIEKSKESLGEERVACGIFAADMQVSINNDGPVTLIYQL